MSRHPRLADWLPPAARRGFNRMLGASLRYRGPYADFATAAAQTRGYDDDAILADVTAATRKVLSGKARYQQDGFAFLVEPPPSMALAGLLLAAARNGGRLAVLDFGGSLASHYLRWRPMLSQVAGLDWCVVEQPGFVAAGRELFSGNAGVAFEPEIARAAAHRPNAVLASSVLQYLPEPERYLAQLGSLGADVLVVDRFPVRRSGPTVALSQHMPARAGGASYALRAFDAGWLSRQLGEHHECVAEFDAADAALHAGPVRADYRGSVWIARRGG